MALFTLAGVACGSGGDDPASELPPPIDDQENPSPDPDPEGRTNVEIVRDERGVPYVYGETREAAFYGLGWATASDRLFQMDYTRRFMRGRMAETFAGRADPQVDAKLIAHDRRMRTLGFHRHAEAVLSHPNFPADTRTALDAYVAGINDYVTRAEFSLPPAFTTAGITSFEPWTAADALLAWERIRERFNADPMAGEINQLEKCAAPGGCFEAPCVPPIDDAAAVVPETTPWPPGDGTASYQPAPKAGRPIEFKASHAWAIHGSRTTTGKPLVAMDPKLALTAPSMWYAFRLAWPGVESAGLGVAGAPAYLMFWNEHVAQTLTAGGGDIADLFELTPAPGGEGYVVDEESLAYDIHEETILVAGRAPISLEVRESRFGPVVTDLLDNAPAGRPFALRHIDLMYDDTHSLVGAIELIEVTDLDSFLAAFDKWLSPGANAIFATDEGETGHIGYMLAGGVGRRAPNVVDGVDLGGRLPFSGATAANDWNGYLSVAERPHVIDPEAGYVFSANHLPVGSWYDAYAYTGAQNVGDTLRSLRLRYLLSDRLGSIDAVVSPAEVHAMHFDARQDAVRLFTEMLRYLAAAGVVPPIEPGAAATSRFDKAAKTLMALDRFLSEGGDVRHSNPMFPVANRVANESPFEMRFGKNPAIFCKYNSAQGGFSLLVKSFDADRDGVMADQDVRDFVIGEAARIWDAVRGEGLSVNPLLWTAPATPPDYLVMYQANQYCPTAMAANCSLDPARDFSVPIDAAAVDTIQSSQGSSGTTTIDFTDIHASRQLVPLGVSEIPDATWFTSGVEAWLDTDAGSPSVPLAPLDRSLIDASSVETLQY
ncbi:MAG: penicillin acylase family protein [Myxococcota bacterium]